MVLALAGDSTITKDLPLAEVVGFVLDFCLVFVGIRVKFYRVVSWVWEKAFKSYLGFNDAVNQNFQEIF